MNTHTSQTAGIGTTGIVIILAVLAVLLGIFITLTDSSDTQEQARTTGPGALETVAQQRAIEETAVVTDAAADRAAILEADVTMSDGMTDAMVESDVDISTAPVTDTTPAVIEPESEPTPTTVAAAGTFGAYDESKLRADTTNVLFFHAEWCPSCTGLEKDLTAKADQIPGNVNILKLDYDSETELKKKYGVIRQHTLVVVDADGNEIKKLTGLTNTLDQVVGQL